MRSFTPITVQIRKSRKSLNGGGRPRVAPIVRFLAKVNKTKTCWLWLASTGRRGYGQFDDGSHMVAAHRFSYSYFIGPIPKGKNILHKCDNPTCVNPSHFEVGDLLKNNRDAWLRGRRIAPAGKLNGMFGKLPWNKGKTWPASVRAKISLKAKGRSAWNKGLHIRLTKGFKYANSRIV